MGERRQAKIDEARRAQPRAELERKATKARRRGYWTVEDIDAAKAEGAELAAYLREADSSLTSEKQR